MTTSNSAPARILTLRPPPRREPLWRNLIGDVLRRERLKQQRTLKDVSESARISMPYLSEVERGRKEASSEVLAAAAAALGMRLIDLLERAHRELEGAAEAEPFVVPQVTSVLEVSSRHTDLARGVGQTSGSVSLAA